MTLAELEGGEGRASMSNSTFEIDAVDGVWEGSISTSWGDKAGDRRGAGEAVQAARPVSDNTSRTSISRRVKQARRSRDGAGASMW